MVKKRIVQSRRKSSLKGSRVSREKERTSAEFVYFMTVVAVLILHYFFISKINVNHTGKVLIDFLIVFIVVGIFTTFMNVKLRKNRNGFDFLFFLFAVGTLVLDYFLISKIAIVSVLQVFIDFAIFTALCGAVMLIFCKARSK
jgi:uncharacterized membrane protein HdeD (DUF308 family)